MLAPWSLAVNRLKYLDKMAGYTEVAAAPGSRNLLFCNNLLPNAAPLRGERRPLASGRA